MLIYVGFPLDKKINLELLKSSKYSEKKIIFVYGGSQGAVNVIKKFLLMLNSLDFKFLTNETTNETNENIASENNNFLLCFMLISNKLKPRVHTSLQGRS